YLHSCNVIHGGIKGANILVEDSGHVCIADFGEITVVKDEDFVEDDPSRFTFTLRWAAPEVIKGEANSKESDIFSFVMVFTGMIPFSSDAYPLAMFSIIQGRHPSRPTHPTFTENLWTLMQRCWGHNPHLHPDASEVLQILLMPVSVSHSLW
ncbi:kinase-like protein, partial [Thelephora ganbajun]